VARRIAAGTPPDRAFDPRERRRVLVRPIDRRVDRRCPVQHTVGIDLRQQRGVDPMPGAVHAEAPGAASRPSAAARTTPAGHATQARSIPEHDRLHDPPVIPERPPAAGNGINGINGINGSIRAHCASDNTRVLNTSHRLARSERRG
jgi:hypothetical protein